MSESPSCAELAQRVRELESRIEDQRTTETRLRGEIAWRRLLIDESRDAIVVLDRGAKVYEANRRFAEMLGYTCRNRRRRRSAPIVNYVTLPVSVVRLRQRCQ